MPTHVWFPVARRPDLLREGVHLSNSTMDRGIDAEGQPFVGADFLVRGVYERGGEKWVRLENVETLAQQDFRVADIGDLSYRMVRRKRTEERLQADRDRDRRRLLAKLRARLPR